MKILIISYFFPPYNTIGAVRVGKTAKYLIKHGHEVRVISAKNPTLDGPVQANLDLEIPSDQVTYTHWIDYNRAGKVMIERLVGNSDAAYGRITTPSQKKSFLNQITQKMAFFYKSVVNFPDGRLGWLPYVLGAYPKNWKPDLIYASAMPATALIAAHLLAKKHSVPWVAELRDLWTDNHGYPYPRWRKPIENKLEMRILSSAKGLVTVSEPLAEKLRAKYSSSTISILNGYDSEDFPKNRKMQKKSDQPLRLIYTGTIYSGWQDPAPLFKAMKKLRSAGKEIHVSFYTFKHCMEPILRAVKKFKIQDQIKIFEPVSYKESLKIQSEADILLQLFWNDSRQKGVFSGKLFEYIGARRPILGVGFTDNGAADIIRDRNLGFVSNDPGPIAQQLQKWIRQKQIQGIADTSRQAASGLSREDQTKVLEKFLARFSDPMRVSSCAES